MTERWWEMSLLAEQAAVGSDPSSPAERLRAAADSEPDAPVAPAFRLWAADGLARAGRDREAVAAYDETLPAAGRSDFEGIDFATEALRNRAGSLARLGDVDGAVAGYRDLAARGDAKQALFRAGVVAERGGRRQQAIELYEEAADPARRPGEGYGQAALRAAQRLAGEAGAFAPSPLAIADRLKAALAGGDAGQLRKLASPTHLQAGPGGGHFQFEDEEILEWLCEDLGRSRPRPFGRSLLGTGGKRYLLTSGWRGKHFKGIVGFCLMRSARGWEWSGILVTGPSDPWLERWEPAEKATNQPLPFELLAPWPEGRCFTAGGLPGFIADMAVIAGAWSFFGLIGAGIAVAFSGRDCGFGLRGFYYNEGPTHSGPNAFAIDFTTYRRWAPFANAARGVPVLSAANGIVRMADGTTSSGDSSHANEVQINHDDPATGKPRFVSRYMHMAGPGMIPVSAGMVAPTGRRLGVINDTGNSVLDHLHFSIHDTAAGSGIGPSVRPTPMEGRSLGDRDSGTCICSTNEERVVIDLPPGCVKAVRREGCARILKRLLGSGR
ncbi:MAG TPA: peptidoglycan DD-metalloendopeptidase family protein [Solirubrobacterales bacterium]